MALSHCRDHAGAISGLVWSVTAGPKGISYSVMSPVLSGTWRADTNAEKIARQEVLNMLATFNLCRPRK